MYKRQDLIRDFNRSQLDKIVLGKTTFGLAGTVGTNLALSEFASVLNDTLVAASTAKIVHSQSTGIVYFNGNGSTIGGEALIVDTPFVNSALLNTDFVLG